MFFESTEASTAGHARRLAASDSLAVVQLVVLVVAMSLATWGLTAGTLHLLTTCPKLVLQVNERGSAVLVNSIFESNRRRLSFWLLCYVSGLFLSTGGSPSEIPSQPNPPFSATSTR